MLQKLPAGVALWLAAWAGHATAADLVFQSPLISESLIVFRAQDVAPGKLPSMITSRDFPTIFLNDLIHACMPLNAPGESVLFYSPGSGDCQRLAHGFEGLSGERRRIESQLENNAYTVVMAQPKPGAPAGICTCPNAPPVVNVTAGQSQTVETGESISTIVFAATDADSEVLFEEFSFTLDGGSQMLGVPAPLMSSCTPGTGTFDCTVSGNAPATAGQYLIRLEVSDGLDSGSATAILNVTAPPPSRFFIDGFEDGT